MIIRKHISAKRKGAITILALLIMGVVLISSLHLVYLTKIQSLITISSVDKIQSYYLAESKINKVFYDDKYFLNSIYPVIWGKLQNSEIPSFKINLDVSDVDINDKDNTITCSFTGYSSVSKRNIVLEAKSIYKGIETSIKAFGPVANDIYELEMPLLDSDNCTEIEDIIKCIQKDILSADFPSDSGYKVIKTYDIEKVIISKNMIKLYRNNLLVKETTLSSSRNFIILGNSSIYKPIEFQIEETENDDDVKFEGLIYIDGNLNINSKFIFKGIIIANGNIYIEPNIVKDSEVKGIVLTDGIINDKSFIKYDRSYIYRYGVYIPDFIKPRLNVYKKL